MIAEIDGVTAGVAAAVEEQGAATREIARNVQQAAIQTRAVSSVVEEVGEHIGETGRAAEAVTGAADNLSNRAQQLGGSVDRFLRHVRQG